VTSSPPDHLVRTHLDRVLRSSAFAKAGRLRAFLRFVVDKTLGGEQDGIKEYSIALAVCGRQASFDAKLDPIVRVDATRLRARLEAYYRFEGQGDTVRIQLPKGAYVPTFAAVAPDTLRPQRAALVVLPFVDLGPRPDESFADGLTEELIHQLSGNPELRVIARTSAFHYRGKGGDLPYIAAQLGIDHVVEGSVRWDGDGLCVTVRLTEVQACSVRWSERYDRHLRDVLAVQDDICRNIAHALHLQLADSARSATPAPIDPRAHVEYLKGRHFWNRRTAAALEHSLQHYGRALVIDPRYAPAHCGIADTLLVQALNEQVDAASALLQARAHTGQATALAPHLAEALTSAAAIASVLEWDWDRGDALFRRAIELNPNFALAHYLHAIMNLAPRGRWDEALIAMDRALELDPVSAVLNRDLGIVHYLRREYRDAEEALHAANALDPGFQGTLFWLGRIQAEQGRLEEAAATFQARWDAPAANTRVLASLVHTLGIMGRRQEAGEMFDRLQREATTSRVPPLNLAIALLGLGQHGDALTQLESALATRAVPLYQLGVDPVYDPLRSSKRFQTILHQMHLDRAGAHRS
jgi:TolB-like protein/Flp pilus assembly protein TadD